MNSLERFLENDRNYEGLFHPPVCGLLELRYKTLFERGTLKDGKYYLDDHVVLAELAILPVRGVNIWNTMAAYEEPLPVLIKNPYNMQTSDFDYFFGERNAVLTDSNSGTVYTGKVTGNELVTVVRSVVASFQDYFREQLKEIIY